MNDPFAWMLEEEKRWAELGLRRALKPSEYEGRVLIKREGRALLNFASNDYLGLARDPRLAEAAENCAKSSGWGAGASPLVSGWSTAHQALAADLARFEQTEAALLFPTGFAANLGTIAALVGKEDAVYLDRLNHACLIDGARLSGASLRIYPHVDHAQLDRTLTRDRGRFRRSLIVTDGVFSMDGNLAPLDHLVEIAEHHDAMLMVDEAHGTGVFGIDGRGASSEFNVCDRVPIRVGTLSKALGSLGGFVAGSQRLIDWLTNRARSLVFSTASPPALMAAAAASLAIAQAEPWRRERVRSLGVLVASELRSLGFDVPEVNGPIVPVLVGSPENALELSGLLEAAGLLVPAIRPPTVPSGTSRLRISLSAAHEDGHIDQLLSAFGQARTQGLGLVT